MMFYVTNICINTNLSYKTFIQIIIKYSLFYLSVMNHQHR